MLGIFLDTETNGLDAKKHKILEIAFKIIDLMSGKTVDQFEALIKISSHDWKQSDLVSLKVSGITWSETEQGIPAEEASQAVESLFKKHRLIRGQSVFICQNPSFDRAFFSQILDIATQEKLYIPYHWLDLASMFFGIMMDRAQKKLGPYPWETGFTKDKIASFFHLNSEEQPHRAMNGVDHLIKCYEALAGFPKKMHA